MGRRIGFGMLLVFLGVGLLFLQISGFTWDWTQLWPLVFVFLGMLDMIENGWRGLRGGGGFLLLVGGFLLLFTMGLLPWPLRQAWPVGLILLGLLSLLGERPSMPMAVVLIGGGGFLLAITTGRLAGGWRQFWPVFLILAGLVALVGRDERRPDESRVPAAAPLRSTVPPGQQDRLKILARVRAGELTVEEGAAILEELKEAENREKT
ncbi:MAG: LiaF transmembrane domain-containing protein [Bacteroidota bacterium]